MRAPYGHLAERLASLRSGLDHLDSVEVTLSDGTKLHVRPIRPEDKQGLQEGLRKLSLQSRYLRFHAPVSRLSSDQLRYLTEIDYENHMAWVVENPDDPDDSGVGVARCVRLSDDPTVADAAVTVGDRYQGRGVGTLLFTMVSAWAIEHGIRTLRNYVLAQNDAMLAILDEVGAPRVDEGNGVYRVDMPLPDDPAKLPNTPAMRSLRAAALGRLRFVHLLRH